MRARSLLYDSQEHGAAAAAAAAKNQGGRRASDMVPLVVGALNVATNVAYLLVAYMAFTRRLYGPFSWFLAVTLVSGVYHACRDLDVCVFGADSRALQHLDHVVANIALSRAFLVVASYDLLKTKAARRYQPDMASMYHTRAVPVSYKYVLIKTRFYEIAATLYTVAIIFASQVAFDSLYEYATVIVGGGLVVVASYFYHWELKVLGLRKRFHWQTLSAGLVLAGLAIVVFLLPGSLGRYYHPVWHMLGAYSAALILYGTTRHLRVFHASDLYWHAA